MLKHLPQSNGSVFTTSVIKYLVTALIVFIPLYIKFPLFKIPGTYVSIRMEDFLIGMTFIALLTVYLKDFTKLFKNKISRSILMFWLIGFVSLLSGLFVTETVGGMIGVLHWLRRIEYMILFFVGYIYIKNSKSKDSILYLIKVLLLVNLFIFIYGIGQRYLGFPVIVTQNEEYSKGIALRWINGAHINSTFAGHYDLASYLLLTMPIYINLFFLVKNNLTKIILGVSLALSYWLIAMAASRISIVSLLISIGISLILIKKYKEIILVFLISFIIFGFSPILKARYIRLFDVVKEKITLLGVVYAQNTEVFEDRSTSIRLNVEWPRAIRSLSKNPILGTGYSSISLATDNDFLRALGEVGILGFSAFLLIFINIYKLIIKSLKYLENLDIYEKAFITGFIGGVLGTLTNAMFIDIFEASKFATIFWLFMGITTVKLVQFHNE